jgi:hypothetical protein
VRETGYGWCYGAVGAVVGVWYACVLPGGCSAESELVMTMHAHRKMRVILAGLNVLAGVEKFDC